jgi:mono/diheme cytochrome c family protein
VALTLHQKLTEIAETGHYDMPAIPVHTDEVRAVVAYINSLEPSDTPLPAKARKRP